MCHTRRLQPELWRLMGNFVLIYDVGGAIKYQTGRSDGGWLGIAAPHHLTPSSGLSQARCSALLGS